MILLIVLMFVMLIIAHPANSADVYLYSAHDSQIRYKDYGLTTAGVGVEQCFLPRLCGNAALSTPVLNNDVYRDGERWKTGDVLGHIELRYYLKH